MLHSLVSTVGPKHPRLGISQIRLRCWVPATPPERHGSEHVLQSPHWLNPAAEIQISALLKGLSTCIHVFSLQNRSIHQLFSLRCFSYILSNERTSQRKINRKDKIIKAIDIRKEVDISTGFGRVEITLHWANLYTVVTINSLNSSIRSWSN